MQVQSIATDRISLPDPAIDVRRLWGVVWKNWRSILGLCIVVSMSAGLWAMRIAPVYRASTTIMIESQEAKMVSIEEVYGMPSRMREYFLTQFEIIKNRDIAETVADELDLWHHPKFALPQVGESDADQGLNILAWFSGLFSMVGDNQPTAADVEERRRAAVINRLMAGLTVEPVQFTQLVVVSYESTDRQLAAQIVNTLAQVFIRSQMDAKLQSTREAGDWLSSRLDDLKANLDISQQALQEFRDTEDILDVEGGQALSAQELNELTSRLHEARRVRIGSESILRELGGVANYSVVQLMSMPAVLQHPLVQHMAQSHTDAQQEVTNLARRYGPEHPKMMAANARVESVEVELKRQVLQVAAGIENEYRVAQRNEENLSAQLAVARSDVASLNRKEFRLQELEQKVETDRRLYELFFNRARETTETIGFQTPLARVVEKAAPPITPIRPDKKRIVLIAFLLAGGLGVGLVILRDFLDNTLKSTEDVLDKLDTPVLGSLPDIKTKKGHKGPYLGYLDDVQSGFAEAVRSIRTGLILSGMEKPHKITVVTSTTPGEGKSTVAINLAAALAQMEGVLLIDADLRRPSVAAAFDLSGGAPGLSDLLAQSEKLKDCIYKSESGFDVLPVGTMPPNPLEMMSKVQFKTLVLDLSERYDRVIIDSAPINAVSDALILATMADSLVYVVMADTTPYSLVLKNINTIRYSNLPITGVVLNKLDPRKHGVYGYSQAHHSGDYYGYGQS
ncbi:MAG: polysaccharide biosynthesis tyrosine autokinase [Halioglobus sp.]|nr:polysaccharide biosynthesis tyrosine autokinase [Halioglobus sp.]